MASRRWLAILYLGSLLAFAEVPIFRVHTRTRVAGDAITDHYSHWGSAILLAVDGLDVYRLRVNELCAPPAGRPRKFRNCALPDHPSVRPFGVNYGQYPRVYPPGAMLVGLLPALLHVTTTLSFSTLNLVMILQLILAAHLASLALYFCLSSSVESIPAALPDLRAGWKAFVLLILLPVLHLELAGNALAGIYDPVAILALLLGVLRLGQRKPLQALLALSAGMFLHYRALWCLPLLVVALMQVYDQRRVWSRSPAGWAAVLGSALLLGVSFYCFVTLLPALHRFPITNHFFYGELLAKPQRLLSLAVPVAALFAVLLRQGNWLTGSLMGWHLLVLLQTREAQPWHALFLVPLIAVAARERRAPPVAVLVTFLLFVWESRELFLTWTLTGRRLIDLFTG